MEALPLVLSADDCRERARQFFARAVAENDLTQREAWLLQGERWMQRWRYWAPDLARSDREREAYGR
ncbi:hypothetical protein BH10PSE1_BH10PSE1_08210 [soil metagenome]